MTRRAPSGKRNPARGASGVVYPISLCMIVRNEEDFLGDALTSVQGVVDEICIVDTGSTDGTVAIAESFGAHISFVEWRDDFAWARNAALALATGAWIFVLDADERLAPESRDHLLALRSVRPDGRGRWIRCRNYNDSALETVASTNAIVRIFPNDRQIRYRGTLHEFVAWEGADRAIEADRTPIEIVHHGYTHALMVARDKAERNLRVSRGAYEAAPDDPVMVYNYAMSALLAARTDTARDLLERVVTLTAGTPRGFRPMALTKLAEVYLEDGRPQRALSLADECLTIVPTYPDAHFVRGRALIALGRHHDAREALGPAITFGSNKTFEHFVVDDEIGIWKAHNEIAGSFVHERRYDEAVKWLDLALKARPAERTLLVNRAKCCESLGDLAGAAAGFRALFDVCGDETAAIEYVNYVFRHGSPDDVLATVETVLPVLGDDYRQAFLVSAAAGMLRAGRRGEAAALLRRVVAGGGDDEKKGRAMIAALAQQYGTPELNGLLDGDIPHANTVAGGLT